MYILAPGSPISPTAGLLNLGTTGIMGRIIPCCFGGGGGGGCPVDPRMFSSISGLYSIDARSTPCPNMATKNVFNMLPNVRGG